MNLQVRDVKEGELPLMGLWRGYQSVAFLWANPLFVVCVDGPLGSQNR